MIKAKRVRSLENVARTGRKRMYKILVWKGNTGKTKTKEDNI
jgi:hypothetical protein